MESTASSALVSKTIAIVFTSSLLLTDAAHNHRAIWRVPSDPTPYPSFRNSTAILSWENLFPSLVLSSLSVSHHNNHLTDITPLSESTLIIHGPSSLDWGNRHFLLLCWLFQVRTSFLGLVSFYFWQSASICPPDRRGLLQVVQIEGRSIIIGCRWNPENSRAILHSMAIYMDP